MNQQMVDFLALEAAKEPFHHIHAAGSGNLTALKHALKERGVVLSEHPALDVPGIYLRYGPGLPSGGPGDLPVRERLRSAS